MGLQEERMDAIKKMLLEHKGKANAIRAGKIGKDLNIPQNDTMQNVRALIAKLIINEEMPIGACGNGYFIIENEQELADYVKYLQQRILQTTNRMATVVSNFEGIHGKGNRRTTLDMF
jgi:hypothetical protein